MLVIDGRQGEGGGQILRLSLSLAALTGRSFHLQHIRGGRSRPGLRPQHLTAVRAVATLCQAEVEGARLGSGSLVFQPGRAPQAGDYVFDVRDAAEGGSAGSVTLIAQAILWPLLFAAGPSSVTLRGGTHVPYSPPYHYLAEVVRPAFKRFGASFSLALAAWGWYPAGGGEMLLRTEPAGRLAAVSFAPQPVETVAGLAAVTNLPAHIPQRMVNRAVNLLRQVGLAARIQPARERGSGPGAGLFLWLPQAGFSSLGRKGLPADHVAEAAVADLQAFMDNQAAVDRHLADQLLLPMSLASGTSSLTTSHLTQHTLTACALLRQWLDIAVVVDGPAGGPGRVTVQGLGYDARH